MKLITTEEFEKLKPEEVVGKVVKKETFIALTSLREMTPQAAEDTYQRWLATKRIVETRTIKEDPTGINEDEVLITLEARYVNSERRRENKNKRLIEQGRAAMMGTLPPALRN